MLTLALFAFGEWCDGGLETRPGLYMMTFAVLPSSPYRFFTLPSEWNPKADGRAKEARDDDFTRTCR